MTLTRRLTPALTTPALVAEVEAVRRLLDLAGSSSGEALRRQLAHSLWTGAHPGSIDVDYPIVEDVDAWARAAAAHGIFDQVRGRAALGLVDQGGRLPPHPPLRPAAAGRATAVYLATYQLARMLIALPR